MQKSAQDKIEFWMSIVNEYCFIAITNKLLVQNLISIVTVVMLPNRYRNTLNNKLKSATNI